LRVVVGLFLFFLAHGDGLALADEGCSAAVLITEPPVAGKLACSIGPLAEFAVGSVRPKAAPGDELSLADGDGGGDSPVDALGDGVTLGLWIGEIDGRVDVGVLDGLAPGAQLGDALAPLDEPA
jgi:hypothetical protein